MRMCEIFRGVAAFPELRIRAQNAKKEGRFGLTVVSPPAPELRLGASYQNRCKRGAPFCTRSKKEGRASLVRRDGMHSNN